MPIDTHARVKPEFVIAREKAYYVISRAWKIRLSNRKKGRAEIGIIVDHLRNLLIGKGEQGTEQWMWFHRSARWFLDDSSASPVSYLAICRELDKDPEILRTLLARKSRQPAQSTAEDTPVNGAVAKRKPRFRGKWR